MIPPSVAVRPGSVLLVSDSDWTALALSAILAEYGIATGCARSMAQARVVVAALPPDVVIVDAWVARRSGEASVVRALRAAAVVGPATPLVIVADEPLERAERLALLMDGAWEVLELPADRAELAARLQRWLAVGQYARDLERVAVWDCAESIHTEHGLLLRARELGADAARSRTPIACLAVRMPADDGADADGARWSALVRAVRRSAGRGSDVVGRIGRDTCVVLAPRTGADGAGHLLHRVRAELGADGFPSPGETRCVAEVIDPAPRDAEDAIGLLRRAVRAVASCDARHPGGRRDTVDA